MSNEVPGPSPEHPGSSAADVYRNLGQADKTPGEIQAPPELLTEPEVTIRQRRLRRLNNPNSDSIVGVMEAAETNPHSSKVTLKFAEAKTQNHQDLARELWGDEDMVSQPKLNVAGHDVFMTTHYSLEPDEITIIITTQGDCENEPTRSLVRQTYTDLGLELASRNNARDLDSPISVVVQENTNLSDATYTRKELEAIKHPDTYEAA